MDLSQCLSWAKVAFLSVWPYETAEHLMLKNIFNAGLAVLFQYEKHFFGVNDFHMG